MSVVPLHGVLGGLQFTVVYYLAASITMKTFHLYFFKLSNCSQS